MLLEYKDNRLGGYFALTDEIRYFEAIVAERPQLIHIVWNRSDQSVGLKVDDIPLILRPNQVTTLTFLQQLNLTGTPTGLSFYSFNREFYCVQTHDEEVSCNGIIFFGAQDLPIVTLDDEEVRKFDLLYQVFLDEFRTRDKVQGEMLQMLLKRLIIKVTRLAKEQSNLHTVADSQVELIRKFNNLVEQHFREKRQVADYADLLFKSPKTLSNLFAKYGQKTPLSIIHNRIVLEAKSQLLYTDNTVKEIAMELSFDEVASFHKLFKKIVGKTPQKFKADSLSIAPTAL
ncbi:MAG: helix-turn-helix transcriptional regulator [Bacteroidota bacterium]